MAAPAEESTQAAGIVTWRNSGAPGLTPRLRVSVLGFGAEGLESLGFGASGFGF